MKKQEELKKNVAKSVVIDFKDNFKDEMKRSDELSEKLNNVKIQSEKNQIILNNNWSEYFKNRKKLQGKD